MDASTPGDAADPGAASPRSSGDPGAASGSVTGPVEPVPAPAPAAASAPAAALAPAPAPAPVVLVSACLMGVACTHTGASKTDQRVLALGRSARLIPVCPEVAGGLPVPRPAAERRPDGTVRTEAGDDVTDLYRRGAEHAVALARAAGARLAVLKARSPSCGSGQIYDGSHRRVLVEGDGVTTQALRVAGITVVSEEDLARDGLAGVEPAAAATSTIEAPGA